MNKELMVCVKFFGGFSKKVVIADNCAEYANLIFNNYEDYNGATLILGAIFFTFQIYGDFSGYSDIAIGTSKLFGFSLMQNFATPYFSRDIAEFWRRWHISLSTWFRDYLYIPLGGSRGPKYQQVRNVFIIFIVSGFWHGANWTFIVWGALNAIYFLPLLLLNKNRKHVTSVVAEGKLLPSFKELIQIGTTFGLTVFAWIFFRAESLSHATYFISGIFKTEIELPDFYGRRKATEVMIMIVMMLVIEFLQRAKLHSLNLDEINRSWIRRLVYVALISSVLFYRQVETQEFIYFQF